MISLRYMFRFVFVCWDDFIGLRSSIICPKQKVSNWFKILELSIEINWRLIQAGLASVLFVAESLVGFVPTTSILYVICVPGGSTLNPACLSLNVLKELGYCLGPRPWDHRNWSYRTSSGLGLPPSFHLDAVVRPKLFPSNSLPPLIRGLLIS